MPNPTFFAPLQNTLVPAAAGNPTFTFTRATTAHVTDFEGVLRQAISGEARFHGARRVRNLLNFSNNNTLDGVGASAGCTVTPTTIDYTAASSYHYKGTVSDGVTTVARSFACSVTLSSTNKATIGLRLGGITNAPAPINIPLTSTPTRWTLTVTGTGGQVQMGLDNRAGLGGDGLLGLVTAVDWQIENVTGQTNQAPAEFVSNGVLTAPFHGNGVNGVKYFNTTNGNSVAGNVVTEAAGVAIADTTLLGYFSENAATNRALQSQTFDHATWVKTNVTVTANTTAAPDGTLTGDTLAATGALGTVTQTLTPTAAAHTLSFYLKRLSGSGVVELILDGVATDVTALINSTTWTRVNASKVLAAAPIDITIRLADAGDAVAAWGMQVEAAPVASSYIQTTTVAVVRNGDALSYPVASNVSLSVGTSYCETYFQDAYPVGGYRRVMLVMNGNRLIQYINNAPVRFASELLVSGIAPLIGAINKSANAWDGGTGTSISACMNGGTVATSATGHNNYTSGFLVGYFAANDWLMGSIRNVRFYNTRLTDAQLQQVTTDGDFTGIDQPPLSPGQLAQLYGGRAVMEKRKKKEPTIEVAVHELVAEQGVKPVLDALPKRTQRVLLKEVPEPDLVPLYALLKEVKAASAAAKARILELYAAMEKKRLDEEDDDEEEDQVVSMM